MHNGEKSLLVEFLQASERNINSICQQHLYKNNSHLGFITGMQWTKSRKLLQNFLSDADVRCQMSDCGDKSPENECSGSNLNFTFFFCNSHSCDKSQQTEDNITSRKKPWQPCFTCKKLLILFWAFYQHSPKCI